MGVRSAAVVWCWLALVTPSAVAQPVLIDGTRGTVPITTVMVRRYQQRYPRAQIIQTTTSNAESFTRLLDGQCQLAVTTRSPQPEELEALRKRGIELIELPLAWDVLTVIVSRNNRFIGELTLEELHRLWRADSTVSRWSQLRSGWPNEPIKLYGPARSSDLLAMWMSRLGDATGRARTDFFASDEASEVIEGVGRNDLALGLVSWADYYDAQTALRAVPVGPVGRIAAPGQATVVQGTYPLTQLLVLYVTRQALTHPEVERLASYLLSEASQLVEFAGMFPLEPTASALVRERWVARRALCTLQSLVLPEQLLTQLRASGVAGNAASSESVFAERLLALRRKVGDLARRIAEDTATLGEIDSLVTAVRQELDVLLATHPPARQLDRR
jgi:phosphate transport system substrate-binding protein